MSGKRKRAASPDRAAPAAAASARVFTSSVQQRAQDAAQAAWLDAAVARTEWELEQGNLDALEGLRSEPAHCQAEQRAAWAEALYQTGFPRASTALPPAAREGDSVLAAVVANSRALGIAVLAETQTWIILHLPTCGALALLHTARPGVLEPCLLDIPRLVTSTS